MTNPLVADLRALVRYERDAVEHFGGHYGEEHFTTVEMVPCETGAWVKYSDIAALLTRAATPAKEPEDLLDECLPRVLELLREAGITEPDALKHTLEDHERWRTQAAASLPVPSEGLREKLAEWRVLRPQGFLEHAVVATSQYDAQYRSMAAEILALRRLAATGAAPEPRSRSAALTNQIAHYLTVARSIQVPTDAFDDIRAMLEGELGAAAETPADQKGKP